jgi:hypothetical protein
MTLKESGEFVWFLSYEHKHGRDESCFDSEKAALIEAERIMLEYVDDWGADAADEKKMRDLIDNDLVTAVAEWDEYTGGNEYLVVEKKHIWTYVDNIERLRKAVADGADRS